MIFCVFIRALTISIGWLLLVLHSITTHISQPTSRLVFVLVILVVSCALLDPALPSGGDNPNLAIVGSLVGGHGGGCLKDDDRFDDTNTVAVWQDIHGDNVWSSEDKNQNFIYLSPELDWVISPEKIKSGERPSPPCQTSTAPINTTLKALF